MIATNVSHALGLHMHQPPGNLELLIETNPWEAEQIIRCYERAVRYAAAYPDVAHLHIGFSGILLEQLRDPSIIDRYRHIIDIPAMLDAYRETPNVELIGMGYFHPIFPLIPAADWDDQLVMGRDIMADTFGRAPRGFWPPEMAFSMEMIPALVKAGYDYVVVDGVHVHPEDGVDDVFRPYLACHDGVCISVVPRDRVVSNAQESGLDAAWFAHEVTHRCRFSPRPHEPRLVTTWSDGENGGWFRQMHEGSGFFGHYFAPYMEHVRGGEYPIRPVGLSGYLAEHPPEARARVQTGAWNVGSTSGFDFSQWAGSPGQQRAGEALTALSRRWWSLQGRAERLPPAAREELAAVRRQVLEAETSCYLFWGDDWLPRLDAILEPAERRLDAIEQARAQAQSGAPAGAAPPVAPSGGGTEQPAAAELSVPAAAPAPAPVAVRTPAAVPSASGGRSGAPPAADTDRAFPNTTAGEPDTAAASAPDADAAPVATASAAAKTAGPRPKPAQARERAAGTKPAGTAGKPVTKKTGSGSRASKTTGSRR